jgi:hypothetical protein
MEINANPTKTMESRGHLRGIIFLCVSKGSRANESIDSTISLLEFIVEIL